MATWLYILVVLGVGLGLALFIDRMKARPGSMSGEPKQVSERSKWLYYWFLGRFPVEDDKDKREGGKRK